MDELIHETMTHEEMYLAAIETLENVARRQQAEIERLRRIATLDEYMLDAWREFGRATVRQQTEIDRLREIKRAAGAILAHLEIEPWRVAASTFGPWSAESDRLRRELSELLQTV